MPWEDVFYLYKIDEHDLLQHLGRGFRVMFFEDGAEIPDACESTQLANLSYGMLTRFQQFKGMIEPDSFYKIGR